MQASRFLRTLLALGATAGAGAWLGFRRDMKRACARLDAGSLLAETAAGPVEFARAGEGAPVLVVHGAGGGYDQGLLVAEDLLELGYEIVAPSRFGYLRTPVPADASPAAQADAHAALLDHLGLGRVVVAGASAGAPSAIELALRHPGRVAALILLVPRAWSPDAEVGVERTGLNPAVLRLIESGADFAFWLAMRFARPALIRFLGVPPEVEAAAPQVERERAGAILRSLLPLSRRIAGLRVDGAAAIAEWPLERIRAPTLVVSAEDDLFHTLPAARHTAARIPGAELVVLPEGGHLMVGQGARVRAAIADFLPRHAADLQPCGQPGRQIEANPVSISNRSSLQIGPY